jgi:hypothetical protein
MVWGVESARHTGEREKVWEISVIAQSRKYVHERLDDATKGKF